MHSDYLYYPLASQFHVFLWWIRGRDPRIQMGPNKHACWKRIWWKSLHDTRIIDQPDVFVVRVQCMVKSQPGGTWFWVEPFLLFLFLFVWIRMGIDDVTCQLSNLGFRLNLFSVFGFDAGWIQKLSNAMYPTVFRISCHNLSLTR